MTRIGAIRDGAALVDVSGSFFLPDALFLTLFSALPFMDSVVNDVAGDYSISPVYLTVGGSHDSRVKIVVVPACNAEKTLCQTWDELRRDLVDKETG